MVTQLGLTVTSPGYLVELRYRAVVRLSTMGDLSWNALAWSAADVKVSGLTQDGAGASECQIRLGNTNLAYSALVLNEGAADIGVTIWACYAGATDAADPLMVFDGVIDGADIAADAVQLKCVAQGNATLYSPRVFIGALSGFSRLRPAGSVVAAGNEVFTLPAWSNG